MYSSVVCTQGMLPIQLINLKDSQRNLTLKDLVIDQFILKKDQKWFSTLNSNNLKLCKLVNIYTEQLADHLQYQAPRINHNDIPDCLPCRGSQPAPLSHPACDPCCPGTGPSLYFLSANIIRSSVLEQRFNYLLWPDSTTEEMMTALYILITSTNLLL